MSGYSLEELTEDTLWHRVLSDGRLVTVVPLLGGRARITVGPQDLYYDNVW